MAFLDSATKTTEGRIGPGGFVPLIIINLLDGAAEAENDEDPLWVDFSSIIIIINNMVQPRVAKLIARLEGVEFVPVPTGYGNIMLVEEFLERVEGRSFIDSDGEGRWAMAQLSWPRLLMSRAPVWPSTVKDRPAWATHVVWFNK